MSPLNEPFWSHEASLEPSVIKADSVEAQALAITAAINRIVPTVAGVWDLNDTKDEVPQQTTFIAHKNPGQESVMEGDGRVPVHPQDYSIGGKYRSILKLFISYENLPNTSFAHGTGWLIRPDLMITAGHNVYSWRRTNGRIPGRACEIKAYAGYDGAKSITSSSVEFRRAKRVVTTSQWLDSASSRPRDFALVQFDRPFTDVTPFQYIETPASGDLVLGVVGYPADLKDAETGERGGKMYELFEQTKYDISANPDRMLAHYIDSEGGNSGGPILRGNDFVALGTHVYGGGEFNTASALGRYGNPVQDYIGALDVPLANPGQINMVTVGATHISQEDAATGPQAKEIARLGDNVVHLPSVATDSNEPEFWIFDGAEEVYKLATGLATALGAPIGGVVGTVIAPIISQALSGNHTNADIALQRFLLANQTLLVAESNIHEEGFFDTLGSALTASLKVAVPHIVGSPVIRLPFQDIMKGIGLGASAADKLVTQVADEIARGVILRAQSLNFAKPESSMDIDTEATKASTNESQFLEELVKAAEAHEANRQQKMGEAEPEGWFDDVVGSVKKVADQVVDAHVRIVKQAAETLAEAAVLAAKPITHTVEELTGVKLPRPEGFWDDAAAKLLDFAKPAATLAKLAVGYSNPMGALAIQILEHAGSFVKSESAFENVNGAAEATVIQELRRFSQALILQAILADTHLTTQMARPVSELKAEGFFSDLFKTPGSTTSTVGTGMIAAAGISCGVPVVGQVAAVPLFVGGYLTWFTGQMLDGYKVGH